MPGAKFPSMQPAANGKTRRRSQSERSSTTRRELFAATVELLVERGYASLRTAEIAERAGLSKGALLHHFPTKNDLITAAATDSMDHAVELELARAGQAARSDDPIAKFIEAQRQFFFETFSVVQWELMVASRSDPGLGRRLQDITNRYRAERDKAWLDVLLGAGMNREDADFALEMTLSLWRGFASQYLRDRSRLSELTRRGDKVASLWRSMMDTHLFAVGRTRDNEPVSSDSRALRGHAPDCPETRRDS